ncbi:hypothetical protein NKR23_g4165 [Pleurostoma richardsiae]|uniref:Uncharacterized protein n=1 Tax=Pleurostoma richardsiae TaxID=41990 RepID=A0AA38VVQ6_9PEZI|nr:hypothetical protein NKR23_g4165 [Pleurostoma richardsiae]
MQFLKLTILTTITAFAVSGTAAPASGPTLKARVNANCVGGTEISCHDYWAGTCPARCAVVPFGEGLLCTNDCLTQAAEWCAEWCK